MDYNKYLASTPGEHGGEYYVLHIPKDVVPPREGQELILNDAPVVVQSVSTPADIAKGRGGPVARSMEANGIGWNVNCLPKGHKWLDRYDMGIVEPEPQPQLSSLRRNKMEVEAKSKTQQTDWGPIKEGKFTDWCKKRGHKSVGQSCINEALAAGGHAAKMANFAINASKGKYKHPKKKEKKAELLNHLVRLADVLDQRGLVDEVKQLDAVISEVAQDTSYESTGEPVMLEDFVEQIIGEPLTEPASV